MLRMTDEMWDSEQAKPGGNRVAFMNASNFAVAPVGTLVVGTDRDEGGKNWLIVFHPTLGSVPHGTRIPVVNGDLQPSANRPRWPNHAEIQEFLAGFKRPGE